LLERERTGRGTHVVVSMVHGAHEFAQFAGPLTGALACYRIYECADGRFLTVAALEPKFWRRLCELLERNDLITRAKDAQAELEEIFRARPLDEWLRRFDGEDVCVGPVWTLDEAARYGGSALGSRAPKLGEHTEAWRRELS
jgi:alpha-methylacyl-CoA racemase